MRLAPSLLVIAILSACADASLIAPVNLASHEAALRRDPDVALVTNDNDAGPGSFRAALERASASSDVKRIHVLGRLGTLNVASPLEYRGSQELVIDAPRFTIDGSALAAGEDAFRATSGGDLTLRGLTVRNAPGNGVTVEVPAAAMGTQTIALVDVAILGNDGHGVVINDQLAPEEAGDPDVSPPIPPNSAGSPASVRVLVHGSRFHGNGFGAVDRDGLRINEGGDGSLHVTIRLTTATDNGADGIELDERGAGDVRFEIFGSTFSGNGSFDTSEEPDLDDGIDVDESGEGALIGSVSLTTSSDNLEEGFDFNENDAGDFRVDMGLVEASRNGEEGIDFEEDDDFAGGGDLVTRLSGITTNGNRGGDAGLKIREKGDGNLDADIRFIRASENSTSGIQVREDAGGGMVARIVDARTIGNDGHGIDFDENSAGDLDAAVSHSRSSDNAGFGVRADNAGTGVGTLRLERALLENNGSGDVGGGGVIVTRSS